MQQDEVLQMMLKLFRQMMKDVSVDTCQCACLTHQYLRESTGQQ